jgi:hypothetical protein
MSKREILQDTTFGKQIAEEETEELNTYFVETEEWRRIFAGEVDVVYGVKGAGKSAIYSLLLKRADILRERGVIVVAAENPRGTPVFKDLVADPPTSENEFRALWKFYILALVANELRKADVNGRRDSLVAPLEEAGLIRRELSLKGMLRAALDYARAIVKAESVEGGIQIDHATGMPNGVTGKITLREPSSAQQKLGMVSVDHLFGIANSILTDAKMQIWVLLDRLDVAFAETDELEANALRALFRAYLDLLGFDRISLKIFLRTDIWHRITKEGFREASHITRTADIAWDPRSLMNLVARRMVRNPSLRDFYKIDETKVVADSDKQRQLFYRVFPPQVDSGARRSETFDWMLSRTKDGARETAPRELIHLLTSARHAQLKEFELGQQEPDGEALIGPSAVRAALPPVSKVRLEQTLFAEYPRLRPRLQQLTGEKTAQTPDSLAQIWKVKPEEALAIATELAEIGFFETRGPKNDPTFWVPFLYRDALDMVQGSAE